MAKIVLYRGTVEVETLARYGRVPVGTRAKGSVVVSNNGGPYMSLTRVFKITVGDDPRPFGWTLYFDWDGTEGVPYHWGMPFRGGGVSLVAHGILEYLTQRLKLDIEGHSTGRGNQQFRFVGVEWTEAKVTKAKKPKRQAPKRKHT